MAMDICVNCVYLKSLKAFITSIGETCKCKYCVQEAVCIEQSLLFGHIKERLDEILCPVDNLSGYERAMIFEGGSADPHVFELWEFVSDTHELANEDITKQLLSWLTLEYQKESVGEDVFYVLDDGSLEHNDYAAKWDKFVDGICHERRYFNDSAKAFLTSLLDVIQKDNELDLSYVRKIDGNLSLYRARIMNEKHELEGIEKNPHVELGPPPKHIAGNQRMTPSGISAMYCALDRVTCLSEIRPIVGDVVVSGEFKPISQLRLLDLTLLTTIPELEMDPFDVGFRELSHAREFLKDMTHKLSRPLSRENALGYLSTQVFFEFLQTKYRVGIDGILFPSVQTGNNGENVVLFPESSAIAAGKDNADQVNMNPFDELIPKLFFVENSLRYHRINSVIVDATEEEHYYPLIADDLTKRRLNI